MKYAPTWKVTVRELDGVYLEPGCGVTPIYSPTAHFFHFELTTCVELSPTPGVCVRVRACVFSTAHKVLRTSTCILADTQVYL